MRTLADELRAHPFFTGLSEDCMRLIAGCGERVMFRSGMTLASEGSAANEFYVIERGRVALQLHTSERALCSYKRSMPAIFWAGPGCFRRFAGRLRQERCRMCMPFDSTVNVCAPSVTLIL